MGDFAKYVYNTLPKYIRSVFVMFSGRLYIMDTYSWPQNTKLSVLHLMPCMYSH